MSDTSAMTKNETVQLPPSLWAAVSPSSPVFPTLAGHRKTDVVVIGAGFTGLSTAIHLREQGIEVTVIEAAEPGWGASGRNNGQVIPTLAGSDPSGMRARHGAGGERFNLLLRDSASDLFNLVRKYNISAEAEQTGWVQPVHSPGRIKIAERRVREWSDLGAPVELLDRAAVARMLGSTAWHGGFWNRTGGHINPLALARGMAKVAQILGAHFFIRSEVLDFAYDAAKWTVNTADGTVTAAALVLATNAYTGEFQPNLMPAIAREIIPVRSWQMATAPIRDSIAKTIIPGRQAMSDTHRDLYFARWDARGRLVTGGAAITSGVQAKQLRRDVASRLQWLWPQIGHVSFDYVWNGYIGMTPDNLLRPDLPDYPRAHKLGPLGFAWAGCNGRAVALSIALGRELARAAQGIPDSELGLPFSEPTPRVSQGFLRRIAPLALPFYRYLDRREI